MSVDYPISQAAFIMNLCPLWWCDPIDCKPPTKRHGTPEETALFVEVLGKSDELVSVWGWSDPEHAFANITSHAGGAVFCSFYTPNLSFWKALGNLRSTTPVRLPSHDSGLPLDSSRVYLMFETNEGDTPRILTSQFTGAWLSPDRGSAPVSWAVDPLLADFFPELWNYYAESASANDTFVAGVDGAGYVFLAELGKHAPAYARRAGVYMHRYMPGGGGSVVDVGVADHRWSDVPNASHLEAYVEAAAAEGKGPAPRPSNPGGAAPSLFLNACGSHWGQKLNWWLPDGTPVINSQCMGPADDTSNGHYLYYYRGSLDAADPAADMADRIRWTVAENREEGEPLFVLAFGGLGLYGGHDNFFLFLRRVMALLDPAVFSAVGAQEMARLARAAGQARAVGAGAPE